MKLSEHQIEHFNKQGYLVVRDLVDQSLIKAVKAEYETKMHELIDGWIDEGKMGPEVAKLSFEESLYAAYKESLNYYQPLEISLPKKITPDTQMHHGPAIFNIIVCDEILDAVESLIGPEIFSNPIQHVRLRPPANILDKDKHHSHISYTDWHQDRGVMTPDADDTHMVTVWLAITEADEENGCLHVIPGTHKGPLQHHCPQSHQLAIPESMLNKKMSKPLVVASGDVILFHPHTVHSASPNASDKLRWSFDMRYSVIGEPTGRSKFPEFIARSHNNPSKELRDPDKWAQMWIECKTSLIGDKHLERSRWRWSKDASGCA